MGPFSLEWTDEGVSDQRGITPTIGGPRPWYHVLVTSMAPAPPASSPHEEDESDETEDEDADGDTDADANDQGYVMSRLLLVIGCRTRYLSVKQAARGNANATCATGRI